MPSAPSDTRNALLRQLPSDEYERLRPHLKDVPLEFKQVLYEPDGPIDAVYFVEHGVVSLVMLLDDGATVETGTVGNEGVAGLPLFLATDHGTDRGICQVPGSAKRLAAEHVHAERRRPDSQVLSVVLRYTSAVIKMTAQTAACNRLHPVEERMSRWLLMMLDRVGSSEFALTQEFLAQMLGVRRPTVNIAGATLQKAGLIRYTRGRIGVVDREGLEAASCECYARIRDEFAQALRPPAAFRKAR
jgi:CRP-like cAMP-binding protein